MGKPKQQQIMFKVAQQFFNIASNPLSATCIAVTFKCFYAIHEESFSHYLQMSAHEVNLSQI